MLQEHKLFKNRNKPNRKAIIAALLLLGVVGTLVSLPSLLQRLGLHADYVGQRYLLKDGRALIVTTSHDRLGPNGDATGVFGSELTAPYYELRDGRVAVDVASIQGGPVPIDPQSFNPLLKTRYDDKSVDDPVFLEKIKNSLKVDDVDFTHYDIIFLAGGWGAAYDLGQSSTLGRKVSEAWAAGKTIGGVCHGPLGLLQAVDEHGLPLVKGRHLTAVTDKQVQELNITMTPMHPERDLRAAGAKFESATAFRDFFANHVVTDGRLITGQNQNAGAEVANVMMKVAGGVRR